jgi:hypothetical protein
MDTSAGRKMENIHFCTVRLQFTEGAGETLEPHSESYSGQNIATCYHIQMSETRNLLQLDLTQSAEINVTQNQSHTESAVNIMARARKTVLEMRDVLRIGMYNPSVA